MEATTNAPSPMGQQLKLAVRTLLRGSGQVMFQCSAWTGLFFLLGIFWGSYECHLPQVAWGAVVGLVFSTLAGFLLKQNVADGDQGLWGFNGILVGCAFPTFLANTWLMWISLALFAMFTTWVRQGFNNVMAPWKVNSLTFPFVFMTWIFLLCSRIFEAIDPVGMSHPVAVDVAATAFGVDTGFGHLVIYWLKGVSQVFLINSWVTGIFFLVGLALCNKWAAFWAAAASAISLALALLFKATPTDVANGLFGFSPVLTGIAVGMTFYSVHYKTAIWAVLAIVATFFMQAAMDVFFEPWGMPTLTGPFCVTTWLFLLPLYKFTVADPDHSHWHSAKAK
ncbi:MAG: urea transporter [Bacteroidales bacterium]|nr:urea transporter [Bacteroidales bacterium]